MQTVLNPERLKVVPCSTVHDGLKFVESMTVGGIAVWDSMDGTLAHKTAPVSGLHNFRGPTLEYFAKIKSSLQDTGASLILISQVRSGYRGLRNSAEFLSPYVDMGLRLRHLKSESKFGCKTWTFIEAQCTRNLYFPPGGRAELVFHPQFGLCPEYELLVGVANKYGKGWKEQLNVTEIPRDRESAVSLVRENGHMFDILWRALREKSGNNS